MSAKERILSIRLMDKVTSNPAVAAKLLLHAGLKITEFDDKMNGKGRGESHV